MAPRSKKLLYSAGISVNPAKAYGNLANILNTRGDSEAAEIAYKSALSHRGNMADVHYNLAILLQVSNNTYPAEVGESHHPYKPNRSALSTVDMLITYSSITCTCNDKTRTMEYPEFLGFGDSDWKWTPGLYLD